MSVATLERQRADLWDSIWQMVVAKDERGNADSVDNLARAPQHRALDGLAEDKMLQIRQVVNATGPIEERLEYLLENAKDTSVHPAPRCFAAIGAAWLADSFASVTEHLEQMCVVDNMYALPLSLASFVYCLSLVTTNAATNKVDAKARATYMVHGCLPTLIFLFNSPSQTAKELRAIEHVVETLRGHIESVTLSLARDRCSHIFAWCDAVLAVHYAEHGAECDHTLLAKARTHARKTRTVINDFSVRLEHEVYLEFVRLGVANSQPKPAGEPAFACNVLTCLAEMQQIYTLKNENERVQWFFERMQILEYAIVEWVKGKEPKYGGLLFASTWAVIRPLLPELARQHNPEMEIQEREYLEKAASMPLRQFAECARWSRHWREIWNLMLDAFVLHEIEPRCPSMNSLYNDIMKNGY